MAAQTHIIINRDGVEARGLPYILARLANTKSAFFPSSFTFAPPPDKFKTEAALRKLNSLQKEVYPPSGYPYSHHLHSLA